MFSVRYVSPGGRLWDLTGSNGTGFSLKAGGVEGLVGRSDVVSSSSEGLPGRLVTSHNVLPMDGSLEGILFPSEGFSLGETFRRWRADWDREEYGQLIVGSPTGQWSAWVRLSGDGMSAPDTSLSDEKFINPLRVDIESDDGVFFGVPQVQSGSVTVTNTGDTTVWPRVRWSGDNQSITFPSSNTLSLPNTVNSRVLHLDPAESHAVEDTQGVLDHMMWKQLRGKILPEGIPKGESRQYSLTSEAFLEWELTTLDPWGW